MTRLEPIFEIRKTRMPNRNHSNQSQRYTCLRDGLPMHTTYSQQKQQRTPTGNTSVAAVVRRIQNHRSAVDVEASTAVPSNVAEELLRLQTARTLRSTPSIRAREPRSHCSPSRSSNPGAEPRGSLLDSQGSDGEAWTTMLWKCSQPHIMSTNAEA